MATASRTIAAVAVIAALLMTTTAFAQRGDGNQRQRGGQRGGNFQMMGGMPSEANLLRRPDVQKDIKLTDEQKTKLEAMQEEMAAARRARFEGLRVSRGDGGSATQGERRRGNFDRTAMLAEMEKAQKEANIKIQAILTPQQWSRLGEIKIQLAGARAIMDKDIEKKLGLKASQKLQIDKLNTSLQEANGQIRQNARANGVEMADMMAEIEKNNKYFESELAKILTAEQSKLLDEMKGEPFEADENFQQAGFGGRRGDGGGRRRGGSTGGGTGGG